VREFLKTENLFRGLRLALVATFVSAVYMAYEYLVVRHEFVEKQLGGQAITPHYALDVAGMFVALFISATAGFAWARGPRLVGFGTWRRVRHDLPVIIGVGGALAALTLLVLHEHLYRPVTGLQRNPFQPPFVALFEETICRWGIFAIVYRLSRRIWVSVAVSALFNVFVAADTMQRYISVQQIPVESWRFAAIVGVKLVLAVGFAVFYVRKGLLSTMALRFVAALPAPVVAAFG
jgi:hypothetical protein